MAHNSTETVEALVKLLHTEKHAETVATLCEMFLPLAEAQAKRYWQPVIGAEHEELVQVARIGLLEACNTFDRRKGAFPTHALWRIRSVLARYVGNLENPVRMPTQYVFKLPKLRRLEIQMSQELHREPTAEELSDRMGIPEAMIMIMWSYDEGPVELDEPEHQNHPRGLNAREESRVDHFPSPTATPEEILIAKEEAESIVFLVKRRKDK